MAGQFSDAESAFRKALEISPEGVAFRFLLAMDLHDQGRREESLAEALREPAEWARLCGLAIIHHAAGHRTESDETLQELIKTGAGNSDYQIAQVYAERGESDAAFEWLERAYANRDSGLGVMKPSRRFRSLHADPRWAPLLMKMGLDG